MAAATIVVLTGDFGPLDPREVTLSLANPDAGVEPIRRVAVRVEDGSWRVEDLPLPIAGRWQARIDILVSDFELVTLENTVHIRP